jgi:hypothetical protein
MSELGLGSSGTNNQLSTVAETSGQNQYSFYGQWHVQPNSTTKCIEVNYGTTNHRLGDFRAYNHSANASGVVYTTMNLSYDDDASTHSTVIPVSMSEMNVLDALSGYSSSALYLCHKLYYTSANRAAETSAFQTITSSLSWYTPTLMSGHIRTATQRPSGTQSHTVSLNTSGINGTDYIYVDSYISNISGTRLLTLGASVSAGYTTITMTPLVEPWIDAVGTCVSRSGYTGSHTEINNVASSCTGADVPLSRTNKNYSFYLRAVGISSGTWNINPTNCTVRIRHYEDDGTTIRETITLTSQNLNTFSKNGKQFSGTLTNQPTYGEFLKVDITSVSSWGTAYSC